MTDKPESGVQTPLLADNMGQPLINGHMFQFASIVVMLGGIPFDRFTSIDYSQQTERATYYGTHKEPIGTTRGNVSYTCSLTISKDMYPRFVAAVTDGGTRGLAESPFDIEVSYVEPNEALVIDRIEKCRINSVGNSHSQGTDALSVTLELFVPRIRFGILGGVACRNYGDEADIPNIVA